MSLDNIGHLHSRDEIPRKEKAKLTWVGASTLNHTRAHEMLRSACRNLGRLCRVRRTPCRATRPMSTKRMSEDERYLFDLNGKRKRAVDRGRARVTLIARACRVSGCPWGVF